MMGRRQVEHAALFCEFSLERHIPTDNLLRSIDRFVELVSWKFQRVELHPDWTVEPLYRIQNCVNRASAQ
jgi:hypothetical protein